MSNLITTINGVIESHDWSLLNSIRIANAKRYVRKQKKGKTIVHIHTDKIVCTPKRKLMYVGMLSNNTKFFIHQ